MAEDDLGARDDYTREVDEEAAFKQAQVSLDMTSGHCKDIFLLLLRGHHVMMGVRWQDNSRNVGVYQKGTCFCQEFRTSSPKITEQVD